MGVGSYLEKYITWIIQLKNYLKKKMHKSKLYYSPVNGTGLKGWKKAHQCNHCLFQRKEMAQYQNMDMFLTECLG